ncbi:zinc ribbon domain-containing protein, partial [Bacteroides sp. OttesenSCG-928-J23]|nr:zinc ribbon domain-containing protein [Bacteroides sp. OttesenSCG-928-J23]
MSRFDELLEDFMFRAKSVADVAGKKTGDVVELSKLKYQAKQTEWDIEKTYAKLGAIVYESKKSTENFEEIIALAVSEIDALNEKLEELEGKMRAVKKVVKCGSCGKENELSARYCTRCGSELVDEEPAEEAAEPL